MPAQEQNSQLQNVTQENLNTDSCVDFSTLSLPPKTGVSSCSFDVEVKKVVIPSNIADAEIRSMLSKLGVNEVEFTKVAGGYDVKFGTEGGRTFSNDGIRLSPGSFHLTVNGKHLSLTGIEGIDATRAFFSASIDEIHATDNGNGFSVEAIVGGRPKTKTVGEEDAMSGFLETLRANAI